MFAHGKVSLCMPVMEISVQAVYSAMLMFMNLKGLLRLYKLSPFEPC